MSYELIYIGRKLSNMCTLAIVWYIRSVKGICTLYCTIPAYIIAHFTLALYSCNFCDFVASKNRLCLSCLASWWQHSTASFSNMPTFFATVSCKFPKFWAELRIAPTSTLDSIGIIPSVPICYFRTQFVSGLSKWPEMHCSLRSTLWYLTYW